MGVFLQVDVANFSVSLSQEENHDVSLHLLRLLGLKLVPTSESYNEPNMLGGMVCPL